MSICVWDEITPYATDCILCPCVTVSDKSPPEPPKRNCGLAIKITPKKLQTKHSVNHNPRQYNRGCLHPANVSHKETVSLRIIAPERPVRIGATNVNMVASDSDR